MRLPRAEHDLIFTGDSQRAGTLTQRGLPVRAWIGSRVLVAALLCAFSVSAWSLDANQDILIQIRKEGPAVVVEVICPVDAPGSIVWEVLTDYDHMAKFLSNLEYSSVEDTAGNVLRVHQKGKASRGPLTLTFDMVREVELVPHSEIRSRLISGDLKASDFVTRIVVTAEGVNIVHSGRYVPKMWVPPYDRAGADRGRDAEAVRRSQSRDTAPERDVAAADVARRCLFCGAPRLCQITQGICRRRMRMSMMSSPPGDFRRDLAQHADHLRFRQQSDSRTRMKTAAMARCTSTDRKRGTGAPARPGSRDRSGDAAPACRAREPARPTPSCA